MQAAAGGTDGGARPMLLFPEVSVAFASRMASFVQEALFDWKTAIHFLQGTTTNGEYLLPFKSGAFLAGAPVQPVLIRYGKVVSKPDLYFTSVLLAGVDFRQSTCQHACQESMSNHDVSAHDGSNINSLAFGYVYTNVYVQSAPCVQGRVSPAWESIDVKWQIFLMMCSTHSVTAYEVG